MESIVGIFNSLADTKRAAAILRTLGIPEDRITVLSPHTSDAEVEASVPTDDTEQPGMGQAIGGTMGAAFGVAGGATAGALAGDSLEKGTADGLPRDELYVYEDALRRGRSVLIAFADDDAIAENARLGLARAGAETVDAARHEWWLGLRDAEHEHYTSQGGDFKVDEAKYRLGFEAALHPDRRGKSGEEMATNLEKRYGVDSATGAFRQGYERGQRYQVIIVERYQRVPRDEKSSRRAA